MPDVVNVTQTEAWLEVARAAGPKQFLAKHPGYFLLSTEDPAELTTMVETQVAESAGAQKSSRRKLELRWLWPTDDRAEVVTVGRARGCDISYRHPSVSKLHAQLSRGKTLTVTDLGSKNGTRVNGTLLKPNVPEKLSPQDRLHFGHVQTLLLPSTAVYELLMRMG